MDEEIDIGLACQNLRKRRIAFPVTVPYPICAEFFNKLLKFVYHFDFSGLVILIDWDLFVRDFDLKSPDEYCR